MKHEDESETCCVRSHMGATELCSHPLPLQTFCTEYCLSAGDAEIECLSLVEDIFESPFICTS